MCAYLVRSFVSIGNVRLTHTIASTGVRPTSGWFSKISNDLIDLPTDRNQTSCSLFEAARRWKQPYADSLFTPAVPFVRSISVCEYILPIWVVCFKFIIAGLLLLLLFFGESCLSFSPYRMREIERVSECKSEWVCIFGSRQESA